MRSPPEDEDDHKDLAKLNVEPWMAALLDLNPEYPHWGPYEDCMGGPKDGGWRAPLFYDTWVEFAKSFSMPGSYNECVHFYFEVGRASCNCQSCDSTGYNPATRAIKEDFYDFAETGRRWCDKVTQDEVDVLIERGRLGAMSHPERKVTAAEVNAANGRRAPGWSDLDHDSINAYILLETRATRLGVYGLCEGCNGQGYVFTAPKGHVGLVLWILHPRKGASRGVEVKRIEESELPDVFAYLNAAAKRNAERFSGVVERALK